MAVEVDYNPKWNSCCNCNQRISILAVLDLDGYYSGSYCKSCLQEAAKAIEEFETKYPDKE